MKKRKVQNNMMGFLRNAGAALLVLNSILCNAQDSASKKEWFSLHGYLKDLQSMSFTDHIDSLSSINQLHNRLNFKFSFPKNITASLEIRNRIFWGDQLRQIPEFGNIINHYNGLVKLSKLWVNENTLVVHSVVDRLFFQYAYKDWNIRVGRQRINWGINTTWNPNDLFNAYNFLDFDYEERPGTDAIRIQHFFKDYSTLELAYKPGKHPDEHIGAVLYKFNRKKYDFQVLGGVFNTDLVLGGGWAGNIKDAGFKGELSYFHPRSNFGDTTGTLSMSLMADQAFKDGWYVSLAFLLNSRPSGFSAGTGSIFNTELSAKNLFPYKYSFYAGMNKIFSPITTLNFSVIYSPKNNSLILIPFLSRNMAQNLDLDLLAQSFFASENVHYKSLGTSIFLRGKWSF